MRRVARVAAMAAVVAIAASVSSAFVGPRFDVRSRIDILMLATGPSEGPGAPAPKVRQKIRLESVNGGAVVTRGVGASDPLTLTLDGDWQVTKSSPALSSAVTFMDLSVGFPVTKTNSAETKGSLKAGDDVYVGYRPALENLLSTAAFATPPMVPKTAKELLEGNLTTSTLKQKGKLKVDTRTFTRLAGKVLVKGNAVLDDGPYAGWDVKYKLKAKIKPGP